MADTFAFCSLFLILHIIYYYVWCTPYYHYHLIISIDHRLLFLFFLLFVCAHHDVAVATHQAVPHYLHKKKQRPKARKSGITHNNLGNKKWYTNALGIWGKSYDEILLETLNLPILQTIFPKLTMNISFFGG